MVADLYVRAGTLRQTLNYHSGPVTCLDFNSSDDLLLSGSADKSIVFWDPKMGRVVVFHVPPLWIASRL